MMKYPCDSVTTKKSWKKEVKEIKADFAVKEKKLKTAKRRGGNIFEKIKQILQGKSVITA